MLSLLLASLPPHSPLLIIVLHAGCDQGRFIPSPTSKKSCSPIIARDLYANYAQPIISLPSTPPPPPHFDHCPPTPYGVTGGELIPSPHLKGQHSHQTRFSPSLQPAKYGATLTISQPHMPQQHGLTRDKDIAIISSPLL